MKLFLNENRRKMKKLYKEKMKDRYKIKGIKFDYTKKDIKRYLIPSNEKDLEKLKKEREENLLIQNYNQLKHEIFVREQKEKDLSKKEKDNNLLGPFNYTKILKIIEQFLSLKSDKNRDDPFNYNYNLTNGKMIIENMNRNIRRNRINESLKKIVLHFQKIKSKLDTGDRQLYFSEKIAGKIKNRIENHIKKINTKNKVTSKNSTILLDSRYKYNSYNTNYTNNNNSIINNNKKTFTYNIDSNYNETTTNKTNINNNLRISTCRPKMKKNINMNKNKNNSAKQLCFSLISSNEEKPKKLNNIKYELINNRKMRFHSNVKSNENLLKRYNKNNKNKKISLSSSNLSHYSNLSLKEKNTLLENKNTIDPSEILTEDYNTIDLMKKYNSYYIKKNYSKKMLSKRPQSCIYIKNKNNEKYIFNETSLTKNNYIRSSSAVKRKSYLKVKNLPIYTTNIKDFIHEYNRIKKNIKKLKKTYEERHFSTYKEIENLLKVKEDMQMFLLKQKYFHSKFKPKPSEIRKNKKDFINKIKKDIDILEENPKVYFKFENLKI